MSNKSKNFKSNLFYFLFATLLVAAFAGCNDGSEDTSNAGTAGVSSSLPSKHALPGVPQE